MKQSRLSGTRRVAGLAAGWGHCLAWSTSSLSLAGREWEQNLYGWGLGDAQRLGEACAWGLASFGHGHGHGGAGYCGTRTKPLALVVMQGSPPMRFPRLCVEGTEAQVRRRR